MASAVGQAVAQRQQPQKKVPLVETSQPEVPNTDEEEDDGEEEAACFKEVVPESSSQLDMSSQQQRDVAVLMADTPSPAPSVISIHSDLSDGEDERDEDTHLQE